ncbi:hypothetical protein ACGFNU_01350 [Spirillospora sp. NPDC048911]|uniref:hypothetical protein n=1 Tax=Spirillospora sp. NPDC048911 TaxID=3364527 RepID=UPI00371C05F4
MITNTPNFPEDTPVLVWYPPPGANDQDRTSWAWLPGTVLERCGPDEWSVVIDGRDDLSEPDPHDPQCRLYPMCFRDSTELRTITTRAWEQSTVRGESADG